MNDEFKPGDKVRLTHEDGDTLRGWVPETRPVGYAEDPIQTAASFATLDWWRKNGWTIELVEHAPVIPTALGVYLDSHGDVWINGRNGMEVASSGGRSDRTRIAWSGYRFSATETANYAPYKRLYTLDQIADGVAAVGYSGSAERIRHIFDD